jgi:hypothetical protein
LLALSGASIRMRIVSPTPTPALAKVLQLKRTERYCRPEAERKAERQSAIPSVTRSDLSLPAPKHTPYRFCDTLNTAFVFVLEY